MTTRAIRKLEWDNEQDATAALAAGWRLDADDWWWRKRKPTDIVIPASYAHFGFTMEDAPAEDSVYVRSAAFALAFDRGELIAYKLAEEPDDA